jgi:hypothetical protein
MIYIFNCNCVDTRWQQYITLLHTNNTQKTEKGEFGKCGPCPVFASYTLAFALQLSKNHEKTSVRVAQYKNNEQAQYKNNGLTIHRRKTATQHRTAKNTEYTTIQGTLVILYRSFGITHRSHLQGSINPRWDRWVFLKGR